MAGEFRRRGHQVDVIALREPSGPSRPETLFLGSPSRPATYRKLTETLQRTPDETIVILQYAAMYGFRGTNLLLALWVRKFRRRPLWVMFHELYFTPREPVRSKHRALRFLTRQVSKVIAHRADRVFTATEPQTQIVRQFVRRETPVEVLGVPSNLPGNSDTEQVTRLRATLQSNAAQPLIGHFGTYSSPQRIILRDIIEKAAVRFPGWRFVLIGRAGKSFVRELLSRAVIPENAVIASGGVSAQEASCWIDACDLMIQPYPEGAQTNRGSLMATLALGKATITNLGPSSDSLWRNAGFLCVLESAQTEKFLDAAQSILEHNNHRANLETNARAYYEQHFSLKQTIARLERAAGAYAQGAIECR